MNLLNKGVITKLMNSLFNRIKKTNAKYYIGKNSNTNTDKHKIEVYESKPYDFNHTYFSFLYNDQTKLINRIQNYKKFRIEERKHEFLD